MIELLKELHGRKISNVIAGGSNGSIIIFDVDDNYVLFIYCSWRLCLVGDVLVTSNDNNDANTGLLTTEIKKLIDSQIETININEFNDLIIKFYSNKILYVFSNINVDASESQYDENWSVADKSKNLVFTINEKNKILKSNYY
ncbi:MAG: hypothetical protein V4643_15065 [Bacteroidota bacterium]